MKERSEKIYCAWSNSCKKPDKEYLCCNFCSIKDCDVRCKDDIKTCKYLWSLEEHNEYHNRTQNYEKVLTPEEQAKQELRAKKRAEKRQKELDEMKTIMEKRNENN